MKKTTKKPQQQQQKPADARKRLRELDDKELGSVAGGEGINPLFQA